MFARLYDMWLDSEDVTNSTKFFMHINYAFQIRIWQSEKTDAKLIKRCCCSTKLFPSMKCLPYKSLKMKHQTLQKVNLPIDLTDCIYKTKVCLEFN